MRPTWHFVAAEDICWLLDLTAPRILQAAAYYHRRFELDDDVFKKTDGIIQQALEGGNHLTRTELAKRLAQHEIPAEHSVRLAYMMGHAEAIGLTCRGIPQGNQQIYALLSEQAPHAKALERDAALAELARRYFISHGPATLEAYTWWSGLTKSNAQVGLRSVQHDPISQIIEDKTYWFVAPTKPLPTDMQAHLLPHYDEYVVAYTDRQAPFDRRHVGKLDSRQNLLFNHVIVLGGRINWHVEENTATDKRDMRAGRIPPPNR